MFSTTGLNKLERKAQNINRNLLQPVPRKYHLLPNKNIKKQQPLDAELDIIIKNEKPVYITSDTVEGFVNLIPNTTFTYGEFTISLEAEFTTEAYRLDPKNEKRRNCTLPFCFVMP